MFHKLLVSLLLSGCLLFSVCSLAQSPVKHVVLISIDGFRPEMYLDKSWPAPNLRYLMKKGTYAGHLKSVFPAYTHPSHVAMITGALPARSGIGYNQPKNSTGEWNWYYDSIKVPTIFEAIKKAGMTTAAVMWPNTVDGDITYNVSEIWDKNHPGDRATVVKQHTIPKGLYEELEAHATGALDSTSMSDEHFSLDENSARMAGYIFKKYKPNFLTVHFACVDGMQHEYGIDHDSVRLAVGANDRAIGDLLQSIHQSGVEGTTAVIVVGDHGFVTINTVFRVNMLIKDIPAKFMAAGGSAFLYLNAGTDQKRAAGIIEQVTTILNKLPKEKRKIFRIVDKKELDEMGADSAAIMAVTAVPGLVFSGSTKPLQTVNNGPGTLIQQNPLEGIFVPTSGGHHGYDPNIPEMYTGFIAAGAGINKGKSIKELSEPDIAPLIAALLGIEFNTPDGKLAPGIINVQ